MEKTISRRLDSKVSVKETLPVQNPNRVVVFGARVSGSDFLAGRFQSYLKEKGIQDPKVHYVRNIANIEAGFFDYWPVNPNWDYYPDNWNNDESTDHPTLPRGVILLPEMRQYHEMTGIFVPSYVVWSDIKKMCDQYGVPMVTIDKDFTPEQIETEIKKLLPENLTLDSK